MIPPERFRGTVQLLGEVCDESLLGWVMDIPFTQWPQQSAVNGASRPAMVNDPQWHRFGERSDPLVRQILGTWSRRGAELQRLLSVVMPSHNIDTHVDKVSPRHWGRVHVPLMTNALSEFIVGGESHTMKAGYAYLVNIEAPHSVLNAGLTPRIHFMLDVGARG